MNMTYQEAKAAGHAVGPTPAEAGMRPCPTTRDLGFKTAAEAEAAIRVVDGLYGDDGPSGPCLADPRLARYSFVPASSVGARRSFSDEAVSSKQWAGPVSNSPWQGNRAAIEIGDPAICYTCGQTTLQNYAARVFARTPINNSAEVGWFEDNRTNLDGTHVYPDTQCLYTGDINNRVFSETNFCWSYFLSQGSYYVFRVRQYGGMGVADVVKEIFYNGQWNILNHAYFMRCWNGDNTNNCYAEPQSEIYDASRNYFNLNAPVGGEGTNFSDVQLRNATNSWVVFSSAVDGATTPPNVSYSTCYSNYFYNYRTPRGAC